MRLTYISRPPAIRILTLLFFTLLLTGCLESSYDVSQDADPVFPIQPGSYLNIIQDERIIVTLEDGTYVGKNVVSGASSGSTHKYKVFKIPKQWNKFVLQRIEGDKSFSYFVITIYKDTIASFEVSIDPKKLSPDEKGFFKIDPNNASKFSIPDHRFLLKAFQIMAEKGSDPKVEHVYVKE